MFAVETVLRARTLVPKLDDDDATASKKVLDLIVRRCAKSVDFKTRL